MLTLTNHLENLADATLTAIVAHPTEFSNDARRAAVLRPALPPYSQVRVLPGTTVVQRRAILAAVQAIAADKPDRGADIQAWIGGQTLPLIVNGQPDADLLGDLNAAIATLDAGNAEATATLRATATGLLLSGPIPDNDEVVAAAKQARRNKAADVYRKQTESLIEAATATVQTNREAGRLAVEAWDGTGSVPGSEGGG